MSKPTTSRGYDGQHASTCERVLVTLLRGLGPWKRSVCLVGGLTPRYLVRERPPAVPAHAGTMDVDVVMDLAMLTDTGAYHSLADNLRRMSFASAGNEHGQKLSWRWETRAEDGALIVLELLADAPHIAGGKVQPLPTDGAVSALNIPHSSIVFDLHEVTEVQAELLGGGGVAIEMIKHADLVSFTCLKALAFEDRFERKDAHDLVYCIEHSAEGLEAAAAAFRAARGDRHGHVIDESLRILRRRFADEERLDGYLKDGPVSVATFELGEGGEPWRREARARRQRDASGVIDRLLRLIG